MNIKKRNYFFNACILTVFYFFQENYSQEIVRVGAVVRLVHRPPDRAVRVRAQAGELPSVSWTRQLLSYSLSLPRINATCKCNAGW